jgi:peptide/nickel transport system permease protein
MYAYILRKLLYSVPVYLGIILLVMLALRVNDPVGAYLGKMASPEQISKLRRDMGLDRSFAAQYVDQLKNVLTLDFSERSWEQKRPVGEILASSVVPSLSITLPALVLTTIIAIVIAMVAAYVRGTVTDKTLMFGAVIGMSVSLLVYVVLGQYFGAAWPRSKGVDVFAIEGYASVFERGGVANWAYYCLLPVLITVILTIGYDTRFYRAVMVEECSRDYIVTAMAKGASKPKIMFVHMLKNAMIPIITHVMITLPFLITGSIVMEMYFNIPGMGRTLITAIISKDFPVIQNFTVVFAAAFIVTNILTDVLYALVDPRVRLS